MAYSESGKGQPLVFDQEQILVCVHGYPLNRGIWQPQVEGLADAARVLAPDLRGHGQSQPVAGPYSMDLFADDLAAFLDALGVAEPVILCGLSMGGYLAFAFFRRYPERLKGLVLTATRASADTPQGKINRDLAAEAARQDGVVAITQKMLPLILAPDTRDRQPELVERVREIMQSTSLEGVLGDLAALKERPDSTPDLSRINLPTLVVHGEQDQIIPYQEAHAMHDAIPGSLWELIPAAGHLPCLENPVAFNQALCSFILALGG
jgi:pimeloyl-ACP methyl ester carboxylesterase